MSPAYVLQARIKTKPDAAWFDFGDPMSAEAAAASVATMNGGDPQFVYRAFLVDAEPVEGAAVAAVEQAPSRVVVLSSAEVAMLRMWLPLQGEGLDAAAARSKRWEIWRAQSAAVRSLIQKIS